jgi:hypothetical protein
MPQRVKKTFLTVDLGIIVKCSLLAQPSHARNADVMQLTVKKRFDQVVFTWRRMSRECG